MATYEDVVNLALRRSLFYPASEIYANAPAGMYDFGPYGTTIRRKIVEQWRKHYVQKEDMLEIDGAIIMPDDVFKSSGHLSNFNDPMTQCKKCNTVHRADKLLEENSKDQFREAMPVEELTAAIRKLKLVCPKDKGELMDVRPFNMMVKAEVGLFAKTNSYLRPETCQSIFTNWQRMSKTMRMKLPKGIAQFGKVFRNEISPRQTLLRLVEIHQMEAEIFFDPLAIDQAPDWEAVKSYALKIMRAGSDKIEDLTCEQLATQKLVSGKLIAYYLARAQQLFVTLGIPLNKMRWRELDGTERAFYAKEAFDFEVETSTGWRELAANNYRTDYDLSGHQKGSQKDLQFVTPEGRKFLPHVWETSIGLDRTFFTLLEYSYQEDKQKERTWLSLPFAIAPHTAGVFPLLANKPELVAKAEEVYNELRESYDVQYDESGSIGKRYARMDEIGVPWCITIDFDSLNNNDATIRARDTGAQKRVPIAELRDTLYQLITGKMTL